MRKIVLYLTLFSGLFCGLSFCSRAQSSYIDLTLVSSADYNKPLATFSHDVFEQAFKVSSAEGEAFDANLGNALLAFIDLLEPEHSYIIQHEPTYYFVFQYNREKSSYLVMNNSIGEKNQAIYVPTFDEAKLEMLRLLRVFYANTPVFNVTEYKY